MAPSSRSSRLRAATPKTSFGELRRPRRRRMCVYAPLIRQRNYLYGLDSIPWGHTFVGTAFQITLQGPHPTERVIWSFGHGQDWQLSGKWRTHRRLGGDALRLDALRRFRQRYGSIFALTPTGAKSQRARRIELQPRRRKQPRRRTAVETIGRLVRHDPHRRRV